MTRSAPLIFALAALSAATPAADAQEPRYDLLRALVKVNGVEEVLEQFPGPRENLGDVLFVVAGRLPPGQQRYADFSRRVLSSGGMVLLVTDEPADLTPYLMPVAGGRVLIQPGPVRCRNEESCLDGRPDQPILKGQMVPGVIDPNLLLLSNLTKVATIAPARILLLPPGGEQPQPVPVGILPVGTTGPAGERLTGGPVVVPFNPAAVPPAPGTAVVIADADLLGNDLMAAQNPETKQLRTDNFAFAFYLTRFLLNGPAGANRPKRTRCLFVENGRIVPDRDFDTIRLVPGEMPDAPLPVPPIGQLQDKITNLVNQALDEWQTKDLPNRALLGSDGRRYPDILRALAVAAAVLLAAYLLRAGWNARRPAEVVPPPPADPVAEDGLLAERRRSVLRTGQLAEPVRDHLRFLLARWGAPPTPPPPIPMADGRTAIRLPRVEFEGNAGKALTPSLVRLWALAYGPWPTAVPIGTWKELEAMIDQVSRAAAAGRWRFAPDRGTA